MTDDTQNPGVRRTYRAAIKVGEDFITLEETVALPLDASESDIEHAVALGWRIYEAQRNAFNDQIEHIRANAPDAPQPTIRDPEAPASDKQRSYIVALQHDLQWGDEQLIALARSHEIDLVTLTKGQASQLIDFMRHTLEIPQEPEPPRQSEPRQPEARQPDAPRTRPIAEEVEAVTPSPAAIQSIAPPPPQEVIEAVVASPPAPVNKAAPSTSQLSAMLRTIARPTNAEEAEERVPMSGNQRNALSRLAERQNIDLDDIARERFEVTFEELDGQQAADLLRELQRVRGGKR